ncbi:MAG TPA: bifunctional phosphoribosylaminoimidazolecarboxamide formyltransferase/IMP cyclohydrolase [Fimbriimonadaceae bacterium]|nr:bifunctional phosphoribosylaminoimidazolecarboxamide formyltransferase/IMP cyclohydrolase [Fimbriimonadaceae bacterium]HRJ97598.1 bifunctional phosphoribosylaminoimidazolecarboxamide formyltransferase/IMP cyclohydrolase [Fimbriimonadaceae bacterium]
MPRALLSVTDKTGLVDLARGLAARDYEIVATGGTARMLQEAGLTITEVAAVTEFPEMLGGRVKTLHPRIHAGLLADRSDPDHARQLEEARIAPFDVLCVNLYAFEATARRGAEFPEIVESIDIGGPAMIRAAAKNSGNVFVVVDPGDYDFLLQTLDAAPEAAQEARLRLMAKAFRHTAVYDATISRVLAERTGEPLAEAIAWGGRRTLSLRYGENPHQAAALYLDPLAEAGVGAATQIWGKELGYNNLLDADAAWELVLDLPPDACAIVKHGNPCGAAIGNTPADSYRLAKAADPVSAFGGIAAFHGAVDGPTAEAMAEKGNFLEVVVAERFDEDAREVFQSRTGWGQDVRLLEARKAVPGPDVTYRSIRGGMLVQTRDTDQILEWIVAGARAPTETEMRALRFQWAIVRHVKSNAIVVGDAFRMLGVGAGQMNRVQSVRLALDQAGEGARGAVLASDAFFPFPDSVEVAAEAGIAAIVQPGGSKKDAEVVEVADRLGVAMVFTGTRHFRH